MKSNVLTRDEVEEALHMIKVVANNEFEYVERPAPHTGEFILTYKGTSLILRGKITSQWLMHCLKKIGVA
jgi:hypothetical protein